MAYSPILLAHILGGTVGLLSGTAAMSFRKGSARHVLAGRIFVASMLTMGAGAAYLGIVRHQPSNAGGGIFTFYLILTAWLTARRKDGETSKLDWAALLIPLALGTLSWMNGIRVVRSGASSQAGVPVGMIFFLGSVELLAAAGCSHADSRRRSGGKAHRAASLAHVFWTVHCSRVFFLRSFEPALETAFQRRARATLAPGFIQHKFVSGSHHTSARFADFLATPSTLFKGVQKNFLGVSSAARSLGVPQTITAWVSKGCNCREKPK